MADASSRPRVPWWVTVLDIATVALVLIFIRALLGGGMRIVLGEGLRLSFTSWPRVALWTAILLALRHALWRHLPFHSHVLLLARRVVQAEALRAAFAPFVVSRLLVSLIGFLAVVTIGFSYPRKNILENGFLDLWTRYDAAWYGRIAVFGYSVTGFNPESQNPIAFFPGLPISMRAVGRILDIHLWYAGILLVLVAFLAALAVLYRLAREDMPEDQARTALLFVAFYPFATCYSAVLTEAPFLLAAAASFLFLRRDRPLAAVPFALFAGFLRPNGFLLCVPLGILTLMPVARRLGWLPGADTDRSGGWKLPAAKLMVACLPLVGVVVYSAFVRSWTGDPFAWAKAQQAWGRSSWGILDIASARWDLIRALGWWSYPYSFPVEIVEAAAGLFALVAVWPITRRFGLAYGVFVFLALVPPIITMGSVSLGRYTAPLFPIFLWLASAVPPTHRVYWLAAFAMGQALVATLFFSGRPPF